jgi:hypothetical protein
LSNTVAKITSKIVEFTGNKATKAFVGKIVTRKNLKDGVVYAIGSTGYFLTTAEYKMFAEAGAIAQSTIVPQESQQVSQQQRLAAQRRAAAIKQQQQQKAKQQVQQKTATAPRPRVAAVQPAQAPQRTKNVTVQGNQSQTKHKVQPTQQQKRQTTRPVTSAAIGFDEEERQAMFATSDFLMNYPTPSFELETPKHMNLVDKKDDIKDGVTGFFSKIVRKTPKKA